MTEGKKQMNSTYLILTLLVSFILSNCKTRQQSEISNIHIPSKTEGYYYILKVPENESKVVVETCEIKNDEDDICGETYRARWTAFRTSPYLSMDEDSMTYPLEDKVFPSLLSQIQEDIATLKVIADEKEETWSDFFE